MNKNGRILRFALAALAAMLVAACGLKGDLYIPAEETAVAPDQAQNAGDETSGRKKTDNRRPETTP